MSNGIFQLLRSTVVQHRVPSSDLSCDESKNEDAEVDPVADEGLVSGIGVRSAPGLAAGCPGAPAQAIKAASMAECISSSTFVSDSKQRGRRGQWLCLDAKACRRLKAQT